MSNDFRCSACKGTGLAATEAEVQAHADEADKRWRQAAEAVLQAVTVEGQPALDYIALVVRTVERISA